MFNMPTLYIYILFKQIILTIYNIFAFILYSLLINISEQSQPT